MLENWKRERILIWGKTRPELSKTYGELVCTGGVLESSRKLIRLYPIPLRYLDDQIIFQKYQWIEASISRSSSDSRPESYRINLNDIDVKDKIPTIKGNWDKRAEWILHPENIVQSVEKLQHLQKTENRSLGIISPKSITEVTYQPYSLDQRVEWKKTYDAIESRGDLPFLAEEKRDLEPIPPPDYRFKVSFRCNDVECEKDHVFSVLDWEIDALYNALRTRGDSPQLAAVKVKEKLEAICSDNNDRHFFLGNISSHPQVFTIVGLWYPKKSEVLENKMPLLVYG